MANTYITQEVFENLLQSILKDMGCETEIIEVPGLSRLLIKKGEKHIDGKMTMAVQLNPLYEAFMEDRPMLQEVVDFIFNAFKEDKMVTPEYTHLTWSWDEVKDRLYFTVHNRKDPSIQDAVCEEIEDLALVPRVYLEKSDSGILCFKVRKEMLEKWNVSEDEVIRTAKKNAPKLFPAKISPVDEFMDGIIQKLGAGSAEAAEFSANCPPIIIVSTKQQVHGAAALFYDHVLETLSEILGDTFFIIPSSINEFFVMPEGYVYSADCMSRIIKESNRDPNAISANEILSNHGYIFKNGKFSSYV